MKREKLDDAQSIIQSKEAQVVAIFPSPSFRCTRWVHTQSLPSESPGAFPHSTRLHVQEKTLREKLKAVEAAMELCRTEKTCCLCMERKVRHSEKGLCAEGHLTCRECLEVYVGRCADDSPAARRREGRVMCPQRAWGCKAVAWSESELEDAVSVPVFADYCRAKVRLLATKRRAKFALIVAVSAPDLANPINDAKNLQATLEGLGGWTVVMALDRTLKQVKATIKKFAAAVCKAKGDCLIAFGGHGMQVDGKNYLYAADSESKLKSYPTRGGLKQAANVTCLPVHDVQYAFEHAGPGAKVFLLDCYRNGLMGGVNSSVAPTQLANSLVIYSTASGEAADDGWPNVGGDFMWVFCEEIKRSIDEGVSLTVVMQRTRSQLLELDHQLAFDHSALSHEFFFSAEVSLSPLSRPRLHLSNEPLVS